EHVAIGRYDDAGAFAVGYGERDGSGEELRFGGRVLLLDGQKAFADLVLSICLRGGGDKQTDQQNTGRRIPRFIEHIHGLTPSWGRSGFVLPTAQSARRGRMVQIQTVFQGGRYRELSFHGEFVDTGSDPENSAGPFHTF